MAVDALKQYIAHHGSRVVNARYDEWAHGQGLPLGVTLTKKSGLKWAELVQRAGGTCGTRAPRDLSPDEVQAMRRVPQHMTATLRGRSRRGKSTRKEPRFTAGLAGGATPSSRPESHQLAHRQIHPPARAAPGKNPCGGVLRCN